MSTPPFTDAAADPQFSSAPVEHHRTLGRRSQVLLVAAAAIVAAAINIGIATTATLLGVSAGFPALQAQTVLLATAAGILIGTVGWLLIRRVSTRPARTLRLAVPVAVVLSFTPDIIVLNTGALPGTTVPGVGALMIMHLVVVACLVPVLARAFPPGSVADRSS